MPNLSPKTPILERKIVKLREQDLGCRQIAERLQEPLWRIHYIIGRLIAAGKLSRRKHRWHPSNARQTANIKALRSGNLSNKKIAAAVGLKLPALYLRLRSLIKKEEVTRRAYGRIGTPASRALTFWKHPDQPRFSWFVDKIERRVPNKVIARELACTAQRVCQIKAAMVIRYGSQLFASRDKLISTRQFSQRVGLPQSEVFALCQTGVLAANQRVKGSPYLIPDAQVEIFLAATKSASA